MHLEPLVLGRSGYLKTFVYIKQISRGVVMRLRHQQIKRTQKKETPKKEISLAAAIVCTSLSISATGCYKMQTEPITDGKVGREAEGETCVSNLDFERLTEIEEILNMKTKRFMALGETLLLIEQGVNVIQYFLENKEIPLNKKEEEKIKEDVEKGLEEIASIKGEAIEVLDEMLAVLEDAERIYKEAGCELAYMDVLAGIAAEVRETRNMLGSADH